MLQPWRSKSATLVKLYQLVGTSTAARSDYPSRPLVPSAETRAAKSIAPGMHGSTFGGNALACRVAVEFFDILDELMPNILDTGAYFQMRLREMAKKFSRRLEAEWKSR